MTSSSELVVSADGESPSTSTATTSENGAATTTEQLKQQQLVQVPEAQASTSSVNGTLHTNGTAPDILDPKRRLLEENLANGVWEVEPVYYTLGNRFSHNGLGNCEAKKTRQGKAYKIPGNTEYECFESHEGVVYWPGDHVYVELAPTDPFLVGTINQFKRAKREQVSIRLNRYYRRSDIPEVSYSLLVQERVEHGIYDKTSEVESRELFAAECLTMFPVSYIRGKCVVHNYRTIAELDKSQLTDSDSFFSCLNFNHDSNRLASYNGTTRLGPRHQAELPPVPTSSVSEDADRDQLLYRPGDVCEEAELDYVRRCRTYRTFRLQSDPRIIQLERDSRLGDLVMDDAITTLHHCAYNIEKAQEIMEQQDTLLSTDSNFFTTDDVKKFTRGIKSFGKNFTKIKKELLPLHQREHLVNFYYMWKKSRDAIRPRPLNRTRTMPKHKQVKNGVPVRAASCDLIDFASASESEDDGEERACHHCYTQESKDWHHAGSNRQLMCTDCRLYFKKYGQMRVVERPAVVPTCLYRGSPTDETGVRTRANGKHRRRLSRERNVDSPGDDKSSRKNRKRLRHSAIPDDTVEEPSPKTNGKRKSEERKEGDGSSSDSGSNKKQLNGYNSGSSSASSPSSKEEPMETEEASEAKPDAVKQETPELPEPAPCNSNSNAVVVAPEKEEKENLEVKIKAEYEDEDYVLLSAPQIVLLDEQHTRDPDEKVSLLMRPNEKKEVLLDADGKKLPTLEPVVFEQIQRRPSGNTCARTDLVYNVDHNQGWVLRRRKREEDRERERALEEKRRLEEAAQLRAASVKPSTSVAPLPFVQQQQPKTPIEMLNSLPPEQVMAAFQRSYGGMPMMQMIDPRQHMLMQQHQQQLMLYEQKMQMAQQMEAARLAAQKQAEEQQRQQRERELQERQQREQAERQREQERQRQQELERQRQISQQQQLTLQQQKAAAMLPVQQQQQAIMLQNQLQQLMASQGFAGANANQLLSAIVQTQHAQATHQAMQAQMEFEARKRLEMEMQQRVAQEAQRQALQQQQQQQVAASSSQSAAAALSHFASQIAVAGLPHAQNPMMQNHNMNLAMMMQQEAANFQLQQMMAQAQAQNPGILEAMRKLSSAEKGRTA